MNNKENVKVFDPNENKSTTYKNLWDAAKAILKGKFIAWNTYIGEKKDPKIMTSASTLRN